MLGTCQKDSGTVRSALLHSSTGKLGPNTCLALVSHPLLGCKSAHSAEQMQQNVPNSQASSSVVTSTATGTASTVGSGTGECCPARIALFHAIVGESMAVALLYAWIALLKCTMLLGCIGLCLNAVGNSFRINIGEQETRHSSTRTIAELYKSYITAIRFHSL
jgi:hypothetical protein